MNEDGKNDYDRIADQLSNGIVSLLKSLRIGPDEFKASGSAFVNCSDFTDAVGSLARLAGWVEGLAESHRGEMTREHDTPNTPSAE